MSNFNQCAILGGTRTHTLRQRWPITSSADEKALLDTLHSGTWGVSGMLGANAFEKRYAAYCQTKHCVTMCNGSVTLRNALLALGVEAGDEVIVPPYTFMATAVAVVEANAVPVFADIDPANWALAPAAVEQAITPKTKGMIVVHLGGTPADMDALTAVAQRHNLFIIEDAAHAHGSEYKGKRVGSLGDIASFSFQSSKNLTCGEGGAVTTNSDHLEALCRSIHNCGRIIGGDWYGHEQLGSNYRLSTFQLALLNVQLDKLDPEVDCRGRNATVLRQLLADFPGFKVAPEPDYTTRNCHHLLRMVYDAEVFDNLPRKMFIKAMCAEGIPLSAGYTVPLYRQNIFLEKRFLAFKNNFTHYDYRDVCCPEAEKLSTATGMFFSQLYLLGNEDDMLDVVRAAQKVYDQRHELLKLSAGVNA